MYRPATVLPSDETYEWARLLYAALGIVSEFSSYSIVGCLAIAFCYIDAPLALWGTILLPVVAFDISTILSAAHCLYKSSSWMLESEWYERLSDILSFSKRIVCCLLIAAHIVTSDREQSVSLLWMVGFSVMAYLSHLWIASYYHVVSYYLYVKLNIWDLGSALLALSVYSKNTGLLDASWSLVLSPCWAVTAAGLIFVTVVIWISAASANIPFRVIQAIFLLMVGAATVFLKELSSYLDKPEPSHIVFWAVPLIVAQTLMLICACIATFAYLVMSAASIQRATENSSLESGRDDSPGSPLLTRDMQITLEQVGEGFFRLVNGPERHPLPGLTTPLLSSDRTEALPEHTETTISTVTAEPAIPSGQHKGTLDAVAVASPVVDLEGEVKPGEHLESSEASSDASKCYVCCSRHTNAVFMYCGHGGLCTDCAQRIFHRSAICPKCRKTIQAVAVYGETPTDSPINARVYDNTR